MKLERGSFVAERYSILDAEENESSVYLAEDRDIRVGSLQVLVNLKVLARELYNPLVLENKVKTLRSVSCDCLIKIFDLIKNSELLAVSMERSPGLKLSNETHNRLYTTFEVVYKLSQIAKGLEFMHQAGIIHGDIREDYIYIEDSGRCKLDPIAPDIGGAHDTIDDVKNLANLGLRLAASTQSSRLWTKHGLRPHKFIKLLQEYAKGQGNLRSFRSKLDRILLNKDFTEGEQPVTYVFNSKAYILIFSLIIITLISCLVFIANSQEFSATLMNFFHHIDASTTK